MAKRILVPLSNDDDVDALIPVVADLARGAGATVRLLHVAPVPENRVDQHNRVIVFASQEYERLQAAGHDRLAVVEARLEGIPVEGSVRFGDVAEATVREADVFGAELIAVRARRRRWWPRLVLGRAVRRITRRATSPVMVVAC